MKIQTKNIDGVFVVTCVGSRLDASVAKPFFEAIQGCIRKGYLRIVVDLSAVEFVDTFGLDAINHCFNELGDRGQLVLCGANMQFKNLLQLTKMEGFFVLEEDQRSAVDLFLSHKRGADTPSPEQDAEKLSSLKMEKKGRGAMVGERRKYKRVPGTQILDEDIIAFCTNIATGKSARAKILNISPGGLLLLLSSESFKVDDELVVEGSVGVNFKFKERAVVRQAFVGKYGMEFMKPSVETTQFLHQLTGAVKLGG